MCMTGPRADAFLALVRRAVAERDASLRSPEVPTIPPEQVRLVGDDSVCVAISRVSRGRRGPYDGPLVVVRAGPRFFLHDSIPESVYVINAGLSAANYTVIDTLQPPPKAGFSLPEPCWTHECLCRPPWTLRTGTSLRRAPNRTAPLIGQLRANTRVNSDTALTVVDVVGLAIVQRPTWSEYLNDTLPAGDSLLTLRWGKAEDSDTRGYVAWWRGLIVHIEQLWDSAGTRGGRSIREPSWTVWAHIDSVGKQRVSGWALMSPEMVTGPNCE